MVYLLKSYIESRACRGGAYTINMLEEIKKYVDKYKRPAIIVVDLFTTLYMLDPGGREVLASGRHILLQQRAEDFFQALIDNGAQLVFFYDGPLKELKLRQWAEKANEKYQRYQMVFEANRTSREVDPSEIANVMTLYYCSYLTTAKKFGKVFVSLKNECDSDTAIFASKVRAFAVISGDTDFLIFPGNWRIWTTERFKIETFQTIEWNKTNLRKSLMLEEKFMPIFATLCGNDFMPRDCVQHIRYEMCKGCFQQRLAELIRRLCPNGTPLCEKERSNLLDVLKRNQKTGFSEKEIEKFFDDSLNFYYCPDQQMGGISPPWLREHILKTQFTIIFVIMRKIPIVLQQPYIDAQQPNVMQFCDLALPLFRRQLGVVLSQKDSRYTHEYWYKPNHDEPFDRRFVNLIKPTIGVPPIETIVTSEEVKIEKKLDILSDIILPGNGKFRKKLELLDIKQPIFLPILKICYLKEHNQITTDEADVLLLSIHESFKMDRETRYNVIPPRIFDPKAFWIGMVYGDINTIFVNCLVVSGLHEFVQPEIYDGYIFHKMYPKFLDKSPEEKNALIEDIKPIRIYAI